MAAKGAGRPVRPGYHDVPMGDRYLQALLVAAAATLAIGCSGTAQQPAHRDSPTPAHRTPAPEYRTLSKVQACRQLLGSLSRHQGVPDIPTLRLIADHVTEPRMAAEARTAVRDIDHTGVATLAMALLRDECARAGVQIPGR
jgi:hypothetical protein